MGTATETTTTAPPATGDDEPVAARPRTDHLARTRVLAPLYGALAVALTWPLAGHLTDSLPYGTEPVRTVPLFNLWTLRWNQDRVGALFRNYWDAPLFHPTKGAFALSEPQPFTGLVFTPLSWLSGNPVLAANLVLLAILAANGWAAARLARRLGAAPGAALLAGVLAEATPFVAAQMGVLQLTVLFPLFLLIEAIVRWAAEGGRRAAAGIGLWLAVTFLTCGYYGLFAVVVIGTSTLVLFRRAWLTRARLAEVGVAAAVFAVLGLPAIITQARITAGYTRPEETIRGLSARTSDFWQLAYETRGGELLPWVGNETSGHPLYPGTALLVLGLVGFSVAHFRYRRQEAEPAEAAETPGADEAGADGDGAEATGEDATPVDGDAEGGEETPGEAEGGEETGAERGAHADARRTLVFLVVGACLARALSLGLNLSVGGFKPYRVMRDVVPGFESLRSPFRFSVLTEIFLVALAAYALDALWRQRARRGGRTLRWGPVAAVVIVAAGVAEVSIAPVRLFEVDQETPDWAQWLDEHADPDVRGDGAVAFVPFPADGRAGSYEHTVVRMLQSLDIGVATVNGYSGLFPSTYDELAHAMEAFPNDVAEATLREYGVSYLVVDAIWLETDIERSRGLAANYRTAFVGEDTVVYEAL